MQPTAISLIPPFLTLAIAFWTKDIRKALVAGLCSAALLVTSFAPVESFKLIFYRILDKSDLSRLSSWSSFKESEELFLFIFLFFLGMVITLLEQSGDAFSYAKFMKKRLKNSKSAEQGSLLLSLILSPDDYLSSITVSSVMPMLTDTFKIPRIKLAFLVTAMAGPLCTLIPISSWGAPILGFISEGGINKHSSTAHIFADPFLTYAKSIPFIFHSIFIVVAAFMIIRMNISYGVIGKHEQIARKSGDLFGGNIPEDYNSSAMHKDNKEHSLLSFLTPLVVLFFGIFLSILYTGNSILFGGVNSLSSSFRDSNMYLSLMIGSFLSLLVASALYLFSAKMSPEKFLSGCWDGIKEMAPSIMVLILAWSFADILKTELHTGQYIARGFMATLRLELVPFAIFLLSAVMAFSVGSSWATMAVAFPIAIPMVPALLKLAVPAAIGSTQIIYPVIGAVLSGAIFGSSLSPIADLLIITSKNTGVNHFEYIKAQAQYLAPVGFASGISFVIAGFASHLSYQNMLLTSFGSGLCLLFLTLKITNKIFQKNNA
jgi:tetracycline resistance efflux pump